MENQRIKDHNCFDRSAELDGKVYASWHTKLIGCRVSFISLWEISPEMTHSSIMHTVKDGKVTTWGEVKTGALPKEIDALPAMTDERIAAVRKWRKEKHAFCYDLLRKMYPELSDTFIEKDGELIGPSPEIDTSVECHVCGKAGLHADRCSEIG